jgi:hypothetical protein
MEKEQEVEVHLNTEDLKSGAEGSSLPENDNDGDETLLPVSESQPSESVTEPEAQFQSLSQREREHEDDEDEPQLEVVDKTPPLSQEENEERSSTCTHQTDVNIPAVPPVPNKE